MCANETVQFHVLFVDSSVISDEIVNSGHNCVQSSICRNFTGRLLHLLPHILRQFELFMVTDVVLGHCLVFLCISETELKHISKCKAVGTYCEMNSYLWLFACWVVVDFISDLLGVSTVPC